VGPQGWALNKLVLEYLLLLSSAAIMVEDDVSCSSCTTELAAARQLEESLKAL
jgi:hypothetical protein